MEGEVGVSARVKVESRTEERRGEVESSPSLTSSPSLRNDVGVNRYNRLVI